jgi:lycopene beta-cyclase
MMDKADIIIAGGGASGLSLACRLADSIELKDKNIIIIDKDSKSTNDRTWCFWEMGESYFESIILHKWQNLRIDGDGEILIKNIMPYSYKMLRAQDFYRFAKDKIGNKKNIKWVHADITKIYTENDVAHVVTNEGEFTATWCFSSIPYQKIDKINNLYLDQHFKGWFIKTMKPTFNSMEAHFMDFRTPQKDETRFMYVLPYNENEALVEIAIFSRIHLSENQYQSIIEVYLENHWNLKREDYIINQEETGNIPMTDASFKEVEGRTIYIGMAGGDTRSSTGFTFINIQRRVERIVKALEIGRNPGETLRFNRFQWYDKVLLRVLEEKTYQGEQLFMRLFRRNPIQRILAFLQGESRILMEIKVMQTAPLKEFISSAMSELMRSKIKRKD